MRDPFQNDDQRSSRIWLFQESETDHFPGEEGCRKEAEKKQKSLGHGKKDQAGTRAERPPFPPRSSPERDVPGSEHEGHHDGTQDFPPADQADSHGDRRQPLRETLSSEKWNRIRPEPPIHIHRLKASQQDQDWKKHTEKSSISSKESHRQTNR